VSGDWAREMGGIDRAGNPRDRRPGALGGRMPCQRFMTRQDAASTIQDAARCRVYVLGRGRIPRLLGLCREIDAQAHLGDLVELLFEAVDVGVFVLEDVDEQVAGGVVGDVGGKLDGLVVEFHGV
jgi:hypothetical protein